MLLAFDVASKSNLDRLQHSQVRKGSLLPLLTFRRVNMGYISLLKNLI